MSVLPENDKDRKMLPLFKFLTGYFPKAFRELTRVSVANNVRFNPGKSPADINWARGKSPDQLGSAFRHLFERQVDGKVFDTVPETVTEETGIKRIYVLAQAMWRIGAALEIEIEEQEAIEAISLVKGDDFAVCSVHDLAAPVSGCDCLECGDARLQATLAV